MSNAPRAWTTIAGQTPAGATIEIQGEETLRKLYLDPAFARVEKDTTVNPPRAKVTSGLTAAIAAKVSGVTGTAPIAVDNTDPTNPVISIAAASGASAGSMSSADKTKLDGIEAAADVTDFANVSTALSSASGNLSFNSVRLTNVADPVDNNDAATKGHVATAAAAAAALTPFGTLVASIASPVTTTGAVTTTLLTLSALLTYTAGSSKRFIIVASSYVSPDDGTTSGYMHILAARTRRQAGGTYTVDTSLYLLNSEQNALADLTITGGATLTVNFVGVAASTIVTTSCRVYEL